MKKTVKNTRVVLADRNEIVSFLDKTLDTFAIKDASCNGLQVQGSAKVDKVGLAVDACMETYQLATENKCQMLITHHGIIWNGLKSISGTVYDHIHYLMQNGLNLYASHLPLDLHPQVGNNIQLAKLLRLENLKPFGMYNGIQIGYEGTLKAKTDRNDLVHQLCASLDTECTVLPFGKEELHSVAIISGGGAKELSEAIQKGVDCYITGEPIHENYHAAMEAGINVIYAGHYHTEKVGVQALGALLEKKFGIETAFLDTPQVIERHIAGELLS